MPACSSSNLHWPVSKVGKVNLPIMFYACPSPHAATDVRAMVEECNSAIARQPALTDTCVFAEDLKAVSKLAGTNAVAVGRLIKGLGGAGVPSWRWAVSDYRCFPVLTAVAAAAAASAPKAAISAD